MRIGLIAPTPLIHAPQCPYSPDLNPIELSFSKLKRLLRAAARTADALEAAIAAALTHFSAAECANHIRHCGYAQSGRWRSRMGSAHLDDRAAGLSLKASEHR